MQDTLIPFAINKSNDALVEVGDVVRGKNCGCVCPSCKQGVIARHGDINAWHFAHDQNSDDKPVNECNISFFSCCRQYIIQMIQEGLISVLCTPGLIATEASSLIFNVCEKGVVTKPHKFTNLVFNKTSHVDLITVINDVELFIHLNYPNLRTPSNPKNQSAGLLSINIEIIKKKFYSRKSEPGLLKELILELFEQDIDNKKWLFHPNAIKVKNDLCVKIEKKVKLLEAKAKISTSPNCYVKQAISSRVGEVVKRRYGRYTCLGCGLEWEGEEFNDACCKKCNSHLLSRFLAI